MSSVKVVKVVKIGSATYSGARAAADNWASWSACEQFKHRRDNNLKDVDFNDWHRRAFRRSLPIFERILRPSKNRSNPRKLIDIVNGVIHRVDNS